MKKILTIIALICFFVGGAEAKLNTKTTKTSISKSNKKKLKAKPVYGSCGYGLLYDSTGKPNGYWSCWEGVDGTNSITFWRVPQE